MARKAKAKPGQAQGDGRYDAIVVGAGPAGLAVGSELARRGCRVRVIDKKAAGRECTKSWFVPKAVLDSRVMTDPGADGYGTHEDLKPFLYEGVRRFLCRTYSGPRVAWNALLPGGYWYIREHEILEYWQKVIEDHGSTVQFGCTYFDHAVESDRVVVVTSDGPIEAQVLVDASGHDSPILAKHQPVRDYYWWSVCGAVVRHPKGLKPGMEVGDYMLWQTFPDTNAHLDEALSHGRPVFEYEILDKDTSFPMILFLRREKVQLDLMKAQFEHILRHEASTSDFHDVQVVEPKFGYYPSGGIDRLHRAEERVVFVGDAGCWSTPCGWGMGFILRNYQPFGAQLFGAIRQGHLDRDRLGELLQPDAHKKFQIVLDEVAARFLSNATAPMLDRFIQCWDDKAKWQHPTDGYLYCEKLFTLTIEHEDLFRVLKVFSKAFTVRELLAIFPRSEYRHVWEMLVEFVGDEAEGLAGRVFGRPVGAEGPGF